VGDNAAKCGYRLGKIHIGKGVMVGMETMIMPGVTIGDGAVIGARSTILKDVPPYTVAMGSPAKVVKEFTQREGSNITEFQE
jgi:acetyltransferase-like isoleucine patch superfamily enzyme